MNQHSDTLELSLQLLRQPSVTPFDHDCQKIMADRLEKAGFKTLALNEFNADACATLRKNRPNWNVIEGDIHKVNFKNFEGKIDLLSGGFPCQAFSHSGKRLGFEDTRGTLFFEFARCVKEFQPKVFIYENVKGLLSHDHGKTFETVFREHGTLKAMFRLLNPRLESLRISRYLVIVRTSFIIDLHLIKVYKTIIKESAQ